jgi:hypothetical protein
MEIQEIVSNKMALEKWLTTLIERKDVCSKYKVNCILDVIHFLAMESQQLIIKESLR